MPLDLPRWAHELIEAERVARLAFSDGDAHPRVLPVTFAVTDGAAWSAIDRKPKRTPEPARVRWLRARPQAALCIDHYADDWAELAWVQLLGRVDVLAAAMPGPAWTPWPPSTRSTGDERPPGPVLRLAVERALHWRAVS